jgi:hypothetical protein
MSPMINSLPFSRAARNLDCNQSLAVKATLAVPRIENCATEKCGVKHPTLSFQALAPGGGTLKGRAPGTLSDTPWASEPI